MAVTAELTQLFDKLRTDAAVQASFRTNPATATEGFALTAHERDAVVSRDLDDFVALGVVASIDQLPAVLRGEPAGPAVPPVVRGGGWGWLAAQVERLRQALRNVRIGGPPRPGPDPPPGPGPGPER
jgi:hypothetical protein